MHAVFLKKSTLFKFWDFKMGSLSWKESVCSVFLIFPILLKLVWRNCQIRFIWRFVLKTESYVQYFPSSNVKELSFTIIIQRFCGKSWLVTYYCCYKVNFWSRVTKSSLMKHKTKIFVCSEKKTSFLTRKRIRYVSFL